MCLAFLFILSIIIMIIFVNRMIEWIKKENPNLFRRSFASKPRLTENMVQKKYLKLKWIQFCVLFDSKTQVYTIFSLKRHSLVRCLAYLCTNSKFGQQIEFYDDTLNSTVVFILYATCLLAEIVMGALTLTCDMCTVCTAH